MKYRVRITKQPKYQSGGSHTLGDFSNMTEDQLENGPVYGFRPEPESEKQVIPVVNTMQELTPVLQPFAAQPVAIKADHVSISDLKKVPEYKGVSVVDFLNQLRLPSSKPFRAKLAKNIGINNYTGTVSQNLKLIDYLNDLQNVFINLGGNYAPHNYVPNHHVTPFVFTPTYKPGWTGPAPRPMPEIQQQEGLSANQVAAISALGLGVAVAPEILPLFSRTKYYSLPKGLPSPRIPYRPQIPGPRNLPGKPFTGWTSSSGHVGPFQDGGEQDQQQQIIEVIKAYAQQSGVDPKTILLQLQKMQPEQQQQAIQQMYAAVSQDVQGDEDMSGDMMTNDSTEYAAYGGQMGYGLDLGARRLWMNQDSDESSKVNDSIEEVPRDQANIEAEGGETALIPDDEGYTHKKIKGNRHTEGGVPLNVPEGTFIYSDTKKMKLGGPVLKMFGKSEKSTKKFTPADLAKQYNLDKYRAILNDPKSDPIAKRTAELMLQNYDKKLAQLALVQEGKKGFPQGIPQVAQNYYNQMVEASGKQNEDIEGTQEDRQELQEETQPQAMYGMGFKYGGGLKQFKGDKDGSEYQGPSLASRTNHYDIITMPKFDKFDDTNIKPFNSLDFKSQFKENEDRINNLGKNEERHYFTDDNGDIIGSNVMLFNYMKRHPYTFKTDADKKFDNKVDNKVDNINTYNDYTPFGLNKMDKRISLANWANVASIMRPTPFEPAVQLQRPQTFYTDPSRALAANAEQANAARQARAMFAGSAPRYASDNVQFGKNPADIIAQYAMQNVGIGNQASAQNAAITNQQMQYDAQRAKRLYDAGVIGEQQYQNAMRQATNIALQHDANAYRNAIINYNMAKTYSPYFTTDIEGRVRWRGPNSAKQFYNSQNDQKNNYAALYEEAVKSADQQNFPNDKQGRTERQNYINNYLKYHTT